MRTHYNGIAYDFNPDYTSKDMAGWDLSERMDMDGAVIYGLILSNETPDAKVLPPNLKGATFIACNLDNVFVPPGNTVIDCSTRRFKVQNDGEDWIIDNKEKPVEPLAKKHFARYGLSIDPKDIPKEKSRGLSVLQKASLEGKK